MIFGATNDIVQKIVQIANSSPPVVLALAALSLLANVIQIGTYFRDRYRLKREKEEQRRLATLVATYEDVLKIAKETVEDKDKLNALKSEIQQQSHQARELTERIKKIELAAQKAVVTREIEYSISLLSKAFLDIKELRSKYHHLGNLPDVPVNERKALEKEVSLAVRRPYELPRQFVFQASLIALLLFLLPWPVDGLVLPMLLPFLLNVIVDAVFLFPDNKFRARTTKWFPLLGFVISVGVWRTFIRSLETIVTTFSGGIGDHSFGELIHIISLPFIFVAGWLQWQSIKGGLGEKIAGLSDDQKRALPGEAEDSPSDEDALRGCDPAPESRT